LLRISDLNFGEGERFATTTEVELGRRAAGDVTRASKKLGTDLEASLILVSRDITRSAKPVELGLARDFLGQLDDSLRVEPKRFVFIRPIAHRQEPRAKTPGSSSVGLVRRRSGP
jgi:hypothetical protein